MFIYQLKVTENGRHDANIVVAGMFYLLKKFIKSNDVPSYLPH